MAKPIARIAGICLKAGVSANGRLYERDAIAAAVKRAQERIAAGDQPMNILTHHGAEDDSTRIVGRITGMSLDEDGNARFEADIAPTEHGRTVATLLDPAGGAYVRGVSIRGAWRGDVKRKLVDGQPAEYGSDGLDLFGLDVTKTPGVAGAAVDTFSRLGSPRESDGRALIFESAADVTFTEAATDHAAPGCDGTCCEECGVNAATESVAEKGAPALKSGKAAAAPTPGFKNYADPGYQDDKAKRYPLDTKSHALAANSYINMAKNARMYTPAQLKRIKARIRAALVKFGVKVTAEHWIITPAELVTESLAEADIWPDRPGCYSVTVDNGTVCISVSSMSVDPADLEVAARAAMEGACAALQTIDPDMDGDIDNPGPDDDEASSGRPDDDAMESAPRRGFLAGLPTLTEMRESVAHDADPETPAAPAGPQEPNTAKEGAGMADPTNTPADQASPAAATPEPATEQAAPQPGLSWTLTDEQFRQLLDRYVPVAAAAPAESAPEAPVAEAAQSEVPVRETQEQLVQRLVAEGVRSALQSHVEQNGVTRKGLVSETATPGAAPVSDEYPESWPRENGVPVQAHKMTAEQWKAVSRDTLPAAVMNARTR